MLATVGDPAALLGVDAAAVAALAHVDLAQGERISRLLDAATALAFALDAAEQSGFRVVASVDEDYPALLVDRLGRSAPPSLYVAGDPRLLAGDLLGVVGSRAVDPDGAEVARGAARAAAAQGLGVVSGGAKGVDRLAMRAALEAATVVCGVLADSLTRTARDPDVRQGISDGALCLCTPYKPTAGFSVANAMGRNKIIYALSRATLVVAAETDKGGTWAGAVEALRQSIASVLVWTGAGGGPGNAELVEGGASGVNAVDDLFPLPAAPRIAGRAAATQLPLDI